MGKNRIKTVTAGRLVTAVCYSQALASDAPPQRAAKSKVSSAARQRMNFRQSWQKLELELAANFGRRDQFVTLTYDNDHLPPDRNAAIEQMRRFLVRCRTHWKRQGRELKYIYNVEEMPDEPGGTKRLHHHLVINARSADADTIAALWGAGNVLSEDLLDGPRDGYEARARYMVKERCPGEFGRKTGLRAWSGSRNLAKPVTKSELVSDALAITIPPGAFVLDSHEERNEFGSYIYLKYLLPEVKPRRRE